MRRKRRKKLPIPPDFQLRLANGEITKIGMVSEPPREHIEWLRRLHSLLLEKYLPEEQNRSEPVLNETEAFIHEILEQLRQEIGEQVCPEDPEGWFETTLGDLLCEAAAAGEDLAVSILVEEFGVDPNVYAHGTRPLHSALWGGQWDTAFLLVQLGADPELTDYWGQTAIRAAAIRDCDEQNSSISAAYAPGWDFWSPDEARDTEEWLLYARAHWLDEEERKRLFGDLKNLPESAEDTDQDAA